MGDDDTTYDVIIVGAGSGGVSLATTLAAHDKRIALVSAGLVGGECPYLACMPSKSLLRSARARVEARTLIEHGAAGRPAELDDDTTAWGSAIKRRDDVANHQDDSEHADELRKQGIIVIRGYGRLDGPGVVVVNDRRLRADHIVLDTGSVASLPDIDGLNDVPTWTSDEALTSDERPERLLVLGGGAIGCELAQAYSGFGVAVTILDAADRLVPTEDPAISERMLTVQQSSGVEVLLGVTPQRAQRFGTGLTLHLDDGRALDGDRLLIVVGRKPATEGLGLGTTDVTIDDDGGVQVDEH